MNQLPEEHYEEIPVSINGRLYFTVHMLKTISKEEAFNWASNDPEILVLLEDKEIQNVVLVPHKLLNIVTK